MANSQPVEEECGSDHVTSGVLIPLILQRQVNIEVVSRVNIQQVNIQQVYIRNIMRCIRCLPSGSIGMMCSRDGYSTYVMVDKSGSLITNDKLNDGVIVNSMNIHDGPFSTSMPFDITDSGDVIYCYADWYSSYDIGTSIYRNSFNNDPNTSTKMWQLESGEKVSNLCFIEPDSLYCSICLPACGRIIKRNILTNQTLQIIEKDKNGENIFMQPTNLTVNKNGDICVIEHTKLIVVDKVGTKRFEYTGTGHGQFQPSFVTCDLQKRILIADQRRVHLLDENGVFIMFLVTAVHHGIQPIRGMDIDGQGRLCLVDHRNGFVVINYADSVTTALRTRSH